MKWLLRCAGSCRRIPKGFRNKAQGCEARATLGKCGIVYANPNGVASSDHPENAATPLGLCRYRSTTQGSSWLATLGWMTQSPWDWKQDRRFIQKIFKPSVLFIVCVLFGCSHNAFAQTRLRRIEEPRWMKLRISEANAGVFAEGTFEETTFQNSSSSITHNHLFIGPSLGLNMEGSIYHPYLFRFLINTEGAYGWGQDNTETPLGSLHRSRMEYLGRFMGSADIFANKPFNVNIFGNYDHSYRDYDFFNRVVVDSLRYGTRLAYTKDDFTFNLSYTRQEEDASGLAGLSTSEQDVVAFQARHSRERGDTTLQYTYNEYNRGDFGRIGAGSDHSVSLADSEKFGAQDQFRLNSSLSYNHRDFFQAPSDEMNGRANLTIDHRPNLSSAYDVGFDHYDSGNFNSENYTGQAQLRHQLYESLSSTLIGQIADYEVSDSFASGYTRRFGGGFSEGYTKRLGTEHRLNITMSLMLEHVDQQSISTIENERHTFAVGVGGASLGGFFLNLPNVQESTVIVTDVNDSQPSFLAGLDYEVTTLGSRTLIQRLPGSRIPANATVLVDYQADPTAAGSYESLNEVFQIRFDLWKNLWGIYARLNLYLNNAPLDLRVQNLTAYTFGTDVTWKWLRAGAEYEIYNSDQSDYRTMRLFQSFSFKPDSASSLGVELSESWSDYAEANRHEENYRFITLYHRRMTHRLRLNFDGGIHLRRGRHVDQTLATARPGIEYIIGKTTIRADYDYEYQLFLNNEERSKHLFFLRMKRVF